MWQDPEKKLTEHLQKTNTIQIESLILAEWNMNDFQKIANTGTYRYRPLTSSSQYYRLPTKYDPLDAGDFYTDAEKSFFTFADFVDENDEPVIFQSEDVNRKLYFDIEQCFYPFRPRSGINKLLYFNQGKTYIDNIKTARRPRYYMSTRYDTFKYWNSYKKQVVGNVPTVVEYGISRINNPTDFNNSIGYLIEDVAPFVVYEESVPANRIVVKMQTNLSEIAESDITTLDGTRISDPLGTRSNSSIPQRWKIEYLDEDNNWIEAISFDENSQRFFSNTPIVDWDGYVELYYGVKLSKPEVYANQFHFVGYVDNDANLPLVGANHGEAYIVGLNETSSGTLYIWDSIEEAWYTEIANYGFSLYEENDSKKIGILSSLTDSKYYLINGKKVYSEFIYLKGLRLSVSTMIGQDKTFDLIELSPRLKVNMSDYTISFNITKNIGDDNTNLPVGSLLASNGDITLMNIDDAFASNNENSIIVKYLKPNIKFDIYEIVLNVEGYDKYIPIQSMYAEDFPHAVDGMKEISVPLRDQFFRFETMRAPDIFLTNTTLTSAISMMLDHCGFSNYIFKGFDDLRTESINVTNSIEYPTFYPPSSVVITGPSGAITTKDLTSFYQNTETKIFYDLEQQWRGYWQAAGQYGFTPVSREITKQDKVNFLSSIYDPVIPFFFVNNETSVAETLSELASATQTAMYFDEYNNFVVVPKEYLLPNTNNQRPTDLVLYGQLTDNNLSNIIDIGASEEKILNDGVIQYSIKYIQRTYNSLAEAQYVDQDKIFVYKPVLLWEVGDNQESRSQDGDKTQASGYALTAVTLNTSLTDSIPTVVSNNIINNIIDIGESAVWIGRFQGYLYANGEIIRYDAVEFSISGVGNVWITSNREYQHYFSKLPFSGKIYPTGNIRIFVEPYYENISSISDVNPSTINLNQGVRYKNGAVQRHGRGQFNTAITSHSAGLPSYWSDNTYMRGIRMENVQEYLFNTKPIDEISYPTAGPVTTLIGAQYDANAIAYDSTRTGIIKNFLRKSYPTDDFIKKLKSTSSGTIQSSALSFTGGPTVRDPIGHISYIYKELPSNYKHFGTRMRIIGRYLEDSTKGQSANNGTSSPTYYSVTPTNSTDSVSISGGSGGIAIGINPNTGHGYFFEICALDNTNLNSYTQINEDTGKTVRSLHNIVFYKTYNRSDNIGVAIPKKLWGGLGTVTIDEGLFVGQDRIGIEDKPTVYDLAVEYKNIGSIRRFYLYINNKEVAVVDDPNPLPQYYNIGLFVRSQSQCMFENVYALQNLQSDNSDALISSGLISRAFGDDIITTSDVMRKYSISGFVKSSFLTGISPTSAPIHGIYFEEFGTILRECAYFNIRYDQAYPALRAILAPTFNNERGYTVSAFNAGAYGAEFLIFNTTDKAIVLDESTGNYLRILGVTFTQQISEQLSVDDFFKRLSNFSNPSKSDGILRSPIVAKEIFDDIESSRKKYGKKEFNIQSEYIQSSEDADKLMEWIMTKVLRKRDRLSVSVFGVPHIQLGDLIKVDYKSNDIQYISTDKIFVVQGISNSKNATSKTTELTLIEV